MVDRARILATFGLRFTDEDQSVMWVTAQDLRHLRVYAPYFYGQSYAGWIEALLAVPLLAAGVAVRTAVPVAAAVVGVLPGLLLALAAWRRRAPLAAAAVLCGFLLMGSEAVALAGMPRGITGGILLATVGVVLVLGPRPPGRWAVAGFALLAVLGASLNQTSVLLSVPAGTYLLVRNRRRVEVWAWGAAGAAAGLVLHGLGQLFYASRPDYALHPAWPLGLDGDVLSRNLGDLDGLLGAYAPDLLRSPVVPLAALATAAVLLAVRRRMAGSVAAAAAVAVLVASLAVPKTTDGTASIFLPRSRFLLALPLLIAYLAVQAVRSERVRPWVSGAVAGSLLAMAVAGFAWRQVGLEERMARLGDAGLGSTLAHGEPRAEPTVDGPVGRPFGGARTAPVVDRCRETGDLAERLGAGLVVYVADRVAGYACAAELYGRVDTLFPAYERRVWRLAEEERLARTAMLVAGADRRLCDRARPGVSCEVVSSGLGMTLLRFPARPALGVVRDLGIDVRPFGSGVDPAVPRSS